MKKILLISLVLVLLVAAAVGGYFGYEAYSLSKIPDPALFMEELMDQQLQSLPMKDAKTENGKALSALIGSSINYEFNEPVLWEKRRASQTVTVVVPDLSEMGSGLEEKAQEVLKVAVEQAKFASDVYDEGKNYRQEWLELAANEAFKTSLESVKTKQTEVTLQLNYTDDRWQLLNGAEVQAALGVSKLDPDAVAAEICAAAVENPEYVRKIYTIDESAKAGPEPDRSKFGSTTDPAVIEELIATELSQTLINGQELVWNRDIDFIPGTQIYYYLDESILTIVWQEEEAMAVGTFSETFIADGSQLRRKIAADQFESFEHEVATVLAQQSNAVLAVGGDLYHHARNCGIVVYEREIYRFDPVTCDTCYITAGGDMLFSYRNQFSDISEAEQFVEENNVLFSLCFGPVLIDNGVDVTPDSYPWGEINDTYARSALGLMGDKHYLTVNINCQQPDYYYLATLRQAADAMVARGCIKAYALDGGQTASTIINNQLINPVQFGWERQTSDILYFASAVPNQ